MLLKICKSNICVNTLATFVYSLLLTIFSHKKKLQNIFIAIISTIARILYTPAMLVRPSVAGAENSTGHSELLPPSFSIQLLSSFSILPSVIKQPFCL